MANFIGKSWHVRLQNVLLPKAKTLVLLPKAKTLVLLPKAKTHFGNACRKRFLRFCNESPPFGGHGPLAQCFVAESEDAGFVAESEDAGFVAESEDAGFVAESEDAFRQRMSETLFTFLQ
jgi:hypothetical protein